VTEADLINNLQQAVLEPLRR